jgi:hypothetical protein
MKSPLRNFGAVRARMRHGRRDAGLTQEGREVSTALPHAVGVDFNNLLLAQGGVG